MDIYFPTRSSFLVESLHRENVLIKRHSVPSNDKYNDREEKGMCNEELVQEHGEQERQDAVEPVKQWVQNETVSKNRTKKLYLKIEQRWTKITYLRDYHDNIIDLNYRMFRGWWNLSGTELNTMEAETSDFLSGHGLIWKPPWSSSSS